jgi:hypothetical protein
MNDQQLHDPRGRIRRVTRLMPDDANVLMARLRRRDHSRCEVARCDIRAGDLVVARRLPQASPRSFENHDRWLQGGDAQ